MVQRPLQLGHGVDRIDQRDVRGGEDPLLVGKAPVLLHPAVEGPEGRGEGGDVIEQGLLHPDTEGREEDGPLEFLRVHETQPGVAILVFGVVGQAIELAEERRRVGTLGVATPEVLVERARLRHGVPGGIGDEPVDPAPTSSRDFPLIWAHCMPRLANCGSMCRVKASGAS